MIKRARERMGETETKEEAVRKVAAEKREAQEAAADTAPLHPQVNNIQLSLALKSTSSPQDKADMDSAHPLSSFLPRQSTNSVRPQNFPPLPPSLPRPRLMRSHSAMGLFCILKNAFIESTQFCKFSIGHSSLPGAIPSSMSGVSNLPFFGPPASPSQSFSIPPNNAQQPNNGCQWEIAIPVSPVKNPGGKTFPLSTSTSFSSFSPIDSTSSTRTQPENNQNPQLPSTLPWPFPPGLSLPAPAQSQNQIQFASTQSRPRLIRSHSVLGKFAFFTVPS